ncbi:unnamed protein product [Umbelopsis vinacea]
MMELLAETIQKQYSIPNVAVAVTEQARFFEKADEIRAWYKSNYPGQEVQLAFIMGYDTVIRLVDQKYYQKPVAEALKPFFEHNIVICADRGGHSKMEVDRFWRSNPIVQKFNKQIRRINLDDNLASISSTQVRNQSKEDMKQLVDENIQHTLPLDLQHFQGVSGHMKFTDLIGEQQDASLKHDEVKSSSNDLQDAAAEASLRHRIGVQNAVMPHDEERNSGSRQSLIANSSIPRTISLSSIPKNLNTSSLSTQIHKSASKQRNLSRLAELSETTTSPQPPVMLPSRQQATPSPKGERTSTPSIPHPLPLSYYRSKTLVLDLDETLIHSTSRGNGVPGASGRAHVIEVVVDKHACLYYVYKRPHVDYFLRKVSEWYKVVVFTASMSEYADPVIDWLDQENRLISKRYFRQSCTLRGGNYLKDLALVEPDLAKVCIVDNSPMAYILNSENGIPIEGWISESGDEALLDLLPFLDALRFTEDVRSVLRLRGGISTRSF